MRRRYDAVNGALARVAASTLVAAVGLLALALSGCQQLREATGSTVPDAVVKRHIWLADPSLKLSQITFTAYDADGIAAENDRRKAKDGGLAYLITTTLSEGERANGAVAEYYVRWKGLRTNPDGGVADVGGEMEFTKTASGAWMSDQGIFDDAGHFMHTANSAGSYAGSGAEGDCALSIRGDGSGTYRCTARTTSAEGAILAFARFDLNGKLAAIYDGPRVVVVGTDDDGSVVKAPAEWKRGLRLKVDAYGGLDSGVLLPFVIGEGRVASHAQTAAVVETAVPEGGERSVRRTERVAPSVTEPAQHEVLELGPSHEKRDHAMRPPTADLPVYNPLSFVQADALLAHGQALHILNGRTRVGLMVGVAQRTRTAVFRLTATEYVQHQTYSYPFNAQSCAQHRDEYLGALEASAHVE